jgi:hypothetical protein
MALRPQDRERGLAVLSEARQTRRRALVFGKVRVREEATLFWLFTFAGLIIFGFAYYAYAQAKLAERKGEVLAKRQAAAAVFGADGFALRDKLESWVMGFAADAVVDRVAAEASVADIARGPGIYLRVRQKDALDVSSLRKAAARSLRDGFSSCLFIGSRGDPKQGTACTSTSQCGPGELCNGWAVCAPPSQPYNLQPLYGALRVLEPGWVSQLGAASDDLQVRAIELDLDDAAKHELVAAAELVRRSKYFTIVLDELPASGEPLPDEGAAGESADERLQATEHFVRVGIWDIASNQQIAALRLQASGRLVPLGRAAPGGVTVATQRAQQRQANNCAVAIEVREAFAAGSIEKHGAAEAVNEPPIELVAGE